MGPFFARFLWHMVALEPCRLPSWGTMLCPGRAEAEGVDERWGFVGPWGDPGPPGLECCCLRAAAREGGGDEGKRPRNIEATSFREQGWARQTGTIAKPKYLTTFHFFSFSPNSLLEGLALKLFLFLMFQQYCSFNLVFGWNIDYLDYF